MNLMLWIGQMFLRNLRGRCNSVDYSISFHNLVLMQGFLIWDGLLGRFLTLCSLLWIDQIASGSANVWYSNTCWNQFEGYRPFEGYRRNYVPQLLAPWGPNVFGHTIAVTTHQPKWRWFAINISYRSSIHFCFQWVWLLLNRCSHVSAFSEFKIHIDCFSGQPVEELEPLDQTLEKEHE